ncbi:halocyanin domain-containing protein [Haloarcula sp. S1CR25-12]|uniref:Halocyanin domain-containing protein n=1 Tax=Haloarcula saliterrae TaxID=2950534 RepID=A0ABU2F6X8_9EURY|nr:halocyanin domain-containing protein [Haloarcula sp. S1CR25-12]MDS0258028.1 halocyanin domain-containing protein [Haloarcula sp. S1CR25-12]
MTDGSTDVSRRAFMRTATGATAAAAATGTAAAQEGTATESGTESGTATGTESGTAAGTESGTASGGGGGGPPDFGGYLDQVGNFSGSVTDARGQDTATVEVGVEANDGPFGFGPAAIHVDNGATVQFEWTGNGNHNVVSDGDGPLDSGSAVGGSGVQYEYTFEEDGIYNYYCSPHEANQMKGSIVVGTDYPTVSTGGSSSTGPLGVPGSAKMLGVATSVVMVATLGLAYVFMRYGGDYDVPADE